jgi:tetratricopeptide (TPR) repeat protein
MLRTGRKWWLIVTVFALAVCGGSCGSDDGPGEILTDDQIVALCDRFIDEIESNSSSDQLSGLEELAQIVAEYDYGKASGVLRELTPYTLEPSDPQELYRMYGAIGLLNGNRSAGLWSTLQAVRLLPSDPLALSQAGTILTDMERCKDAGKFLRKAKHHDEAGDELLRMSLAANHTCQGDLPGAIDELQEAVELAPDNLLAQSALMDLYIQDTPSLSTQREAMYSVCVADIADAVLLESLAEMEAFVTAKSDEVTALTIDLANLYTSLPLDLPDGLILALDANIDAYEAMYYPSYADPLDEDVNAVGTMASDTAETLAQALSDCCEATNYSCSCFYDYCTGYWEMVENDVDPRLYDAVARFLPGAVGLFKAYELEMAGEIIHYRTQMSDAGADWSVRYAYKLLSIQCKEISLEVAYGLEGTFLQHDMAGLNCQMEEACRTAEEAARQAALKLRIEEERRAAAEEARKKALAAEQARDDSIRGELCLDSVGCLGVDGSKLSVKIGGGVFAKFSVDVDKLSVGVRVGVGIGDPTGGNIASADLSVGGEIGPSGTSFDITHSQSYAAGTHVKNYSMFKRSFKF